MKRRRGWTAEQLQMLRDLYPETETAALATRFRKAAQTVNTMASKLGVRKTAEFMRRRAIERPEWVACQFSKGHIPANAGTRRPGWGPGRMKETQFKRGERSGVAARNWRPIGTILPDPEGYLRIKIREAEHGKEPTGFGNTRVWPLLQRHVWEQHHGPIPRGHNVAFKNGNRQDCSIENLECISRAEMAHRNRMWGRLPQELAEAIQLNGALKRKLRRLTDEK